MPQNKTSPLFLVDLPIMFCISFLKGLKHYPKTKQIFFHVILAEANNEQMYAIPELIFLTKKFEIQAELSTLSNLC